MGAAPNALVEPGDRQGHHLRVPLETPALVTREYEHHVLALLERVNELHSVVNASRPDAVANGKINVHHVVALDHEALGVSAVDVEGRVGAALAVQHGTGVELQQPRYGRADQRTVLGRRFVNRIGRHHVHRPVVVGRIHRVLQLRLRRGRYNLVQRREVRYFREHRRHGQDERRGEPVRVGFMRYFCEVDPVCDSLLDARVLRRHGVQLLHHVLEDAVAPLVVDAESVFLKQPAGRHPRVDQLVQKVAELSLHAHPLEPVPAHHRVLSSRAFDVGTFVPLQLEKSRLFTFALDHAECERHEDVALALFSRSCGLTVVTGGL
ncbi:non-ribosomal peptide synthetase [Babesia caballi]|uniref:Non-ribosomal peptide synthetase n=1 Tax=Babesia caballi TaxID=5871 RepID=A0AAV4LLI6_BABCB|nr:non-ribosomal peptide synthetase [Babesia caballi]